MNNLKRFLLFLLIFPIIMILVFPIIIIIDLFEDFVEFLKTIRFLLESTIKDIFVWWRNK